MPAGKGLSTNERWSQSIEKDLEGSSECITLEKEFGYQNRSRTQRRLFRGHCLNKAIQVWWEDRCLHHLLPYVYGVLGGISAASRKPISSNVLEVTAHLEGRKVGYTDGNIGKHGQPFICGNSLEGKVMCDLVNSEEKIVVGSAANSICASKENWRRRMIMAQGY